MPTGSGPRKVIIALYGEEVAPRFDLTTAAHVVRLRTDGRIRDEQTVILPHASAEEFCHLILKEEAQVLICNGIEDEYYQYLTWKRVDVIDSVMGPWPRVLRAFREKRLTGGQSFYLVEG